MTNPNIILVLLDGARWDRTDTCSEFAELKKQGTLLNNVTTAVPYTVGSINVIFSGLYGKENGVDSYYHVLRLKDSVKILSEILKENGYFTSCDLLHKNIIADRGFDIHQAHNEYKDNLLLRHPDFIKKTFEKAKGRPIFSFLFFSRTHTVTVSEVLKRYEWDSQEFYKQKDKNLKRYDEVFNEACLYAKQIKKTIENLGKSNNTIMIFFSDHGTGIGERFGERNYGSFTFEETIRTFYLFIGKEIKKNKVSKKLYSNIDIFPTILELCNIKNEQKRSGISLVPVLGGNLDEKYEKKFVFSETGALHGPYPSPEKSNVFCIKTREYKLMYLETPNQWKLFDLINDPYEQNDISFEKKEVYTKLKKELLAWINR